MKGRNQLRKSARHATGGRDRGATRDRGEAKEESKRAMEVSEDMDGEGRKT